MTRSIPSALKDHYAGPFTRIATCVRVVLRRFQPRITNITKANPGVVATLWEHGLVTGDVVQLAGVEGMTQVNDNFYVVTFLTSMTFSIDQDTSAFSAFLAGTSYGRAHKVFAFTDHQDEIVIGNITYEPAAGFERSAVASRLNLSLDNIDVQAFIDSDRIKHVDIERGLFSGASYEIFEVNYADPAMGSLVLRTGEIGEIRTEDLVFFAEGLGLSNKMHVTFGPLISVTCRAEFGNKVTDFLNERFGCKVRLNPPLWQASTAYTVVNPNDAALGSLVKPAVYNGRHFQCTVAGTSGLTEPVWNTAIGAVTVDGSAQWTTVDATTKTGVVSLPIDNRNFEDHTRSESTHRFTFGLFTWLSGDNKGVETEVKKYALTDRAIVAVNQGAKRFEFIGDGTAFFSPGDVFEVKGSTGNDGFYTVNTDVYNGGTNHTEIVVLEAIPSATANGVISWKPARFELRDKTQEIIQPGDTYEIEAGCDKRLETCKNFKNIYNFRGEPWLPGMDKALLYPDAPTG